MEIERPEKLTADDLGHWPAHTEMKCPCGHERREHADYAHRCGAPCCGCRTYSGPIPTDRDYLRDGWVPPTGPTAAAQMSENVPHQMSEDEAAAFFAGWDGVL